MKYATFSELNEILKEEKQEIEEEEEEVDADLAPKEYDYLLSMTLWSLSQEKVDALILQMTTKKSEYESL